MASDSEMASEEKFSPQEILYPVEKISNSSPKNATKRKFEQSFTEEESNQNNKKANEELNANFGPNFAIQLQV